MITSLTLLAEISNSLIHPHLSSTPPIRSSRSFLKESQFVLLGFRTGRNIVESREISHQICLWPDAEGSSDTYQFVIYLLIQFKQIVGSTTSFRFLVTNVGSASLFRMDRSLEAK